jgi:hypothetical protein
MSKSDQKTQAIKLRKAGWSIKDIAKHLNVSRSSASVWCREITLSAAQSKRLRDKQIAAGHAGRQKGADMNRRKREQAIDDAYVQAKVKITKLEYKELFYLGLGIYWGEGIKSRSGPAAVVNSDARIIKVVIIWLEQCFSVEKSMLRPYIYISEHHKSREKVIVDYWVRELGLSPAQFKSPIYLKQRPSTKYQNHDSYHGVVALRVPKSTNLKYQILALLERVGKTLE